MSASKCRQQLVQHPISSPKSALQRSVYRANMHLVNRLQVNISITEGVKEQVKDHGQKGWPFFGWVSFASLSVGQCAALGYRAQNSLFQSSSLTRPLSARAQSCYIPHLWDSHLPQGLEVSPDVQSEKTIFGDPSSFAVAWRLVLERNGNPGYCV